MDRGGESGTPEMSGAASSAPWDRGVTAAPGSEAELVGRLQSRIRELEDQLSTLGVDPTDGPPHLVPVPVALDLAGAVTDVFPVLHGGFDAAEVGSSVTPVETLATVWAAPMSPPSGEPDTAPRAAHRRSAVVGGRRSWFYAGRSVLAVAAVLTLVVFGLEWNIEQRAQQGLAAHQVSAINLSDPHISTAVPAPSGTSGVEITTGGNAAQAVPLKMFAPENILLLGSDTRSGANAAAGANGSTSGVANSDTIMVAHISGDRQHVTVLSLPRDTMIPAPTCNLWDAATGKYSDQIQPIHPGERFHLSSTFSVGGPRCVVTAVQALTGLGITRMIGIDFVGFQAMVNALGGVTVNICRPVVDTEIGTVVPKGGIQTIFGFQALNLVRARHVIGDSASDLSRIRRQQVVLSAILRQVSSAGTLLNPSRLDAFLQAFTSNTFTDNVTVSDLVTLAGSLGSLDPGHVTFYTMPTVNDPTIDGALDPDPRTAPVVFRALVDDQPLPGQTTPHTSLATPKSSPKRSNPTPTSSSIFTPTAGTSVAAAAGVDPITVNPADVRLQIYNLTGRSGVAGTTQTALSRFGFTVADSQLVRPVNQTQQAVTVLYSAGNRAAADTVAAAVPGSTLILTPGLGTTVRLMLGTSYTGHTTAVTVMATPSTVSSPSLASAPTSTALSTSAPTTPPATLKSADLASVNAGASSCA